MSDFPRLDITPFWATVNDDLITIVDSIPGDKIDWSPKPELWNFRGILLHIASTRDGWAGGAGVEDDAPNVWQTARSKDDIKAAFDRTWRRVARFLADPGKLDGEHTVVWSDGSRDERAAGHWIAFHLLEHDIHHRSDLLHYLALLGVPMPDVGPL